MVSKTAQFQRAPHVTSLSSDLLDIMFQKLKNTAASLRTPSSSRKKSEKPSISWSFTDDEPDTKVEHIWTSANFSRKMKMNNGVNMCSSTFSIQNKESDIVTDWYLSMYPNGYDDENTRVVSIFLYPKEDLRNLQNIPKKMDLFFSIQSAPGKSNMTTKPKGYTFKKIDGRGFKRFATHKTLNDKECGLLPNDTLTIVCQITVRGHTRVTSGPRSSRDGFKMAFRSSMNQYIKDIEDIYVNGDFADFTIVCREKEFPCHQAILAGRSSVFHAMFSNDMEEKRKAKVSLHFQELFHLIVCRYEDIFFDDRY